MAVSGSFDYNNTATELVKDALEYCGKQDRAQTVNADDAESCRKTFNMMMKFWQAREIGLWLTNTITLFLEKDAQSYDIYSSGAHATTDFTKTEIATAGSSTDLTIDVDSISGILDGDYIGIELDDGTLQWTTVDGDPAVTTVTINDALDDDVSVNAHVYAYTTKAEKPLELIDVQLFQSSETEYPVNIITRDEYKRLADKKSVGKAVQAYSDFRIDRMTLHLWPTADSVKDYLVFSAKRRIDDIDSLSNNAALPPEWLLPMSTNLAYWVAPKFGCSTEKIAILKAYADETLQALMMFDQEDTPFTIEPQTR